MSMSDTIADMLTRVRNAYIAKHKSVVIPGSKVKLNIAKVLKSEGYINDFQESTNENNSVNLEVFLKYAKNGGRVLNKIIRVSKPSRRIYVAKDDVKKVKGGLGISILSTSQGVISDRVARERGIGGELICQVW